MKYRRNTSRVTNRPDVLCKPNAWCKCNRGGRGGNACGDLMLDARFALGQDRGVHSTGTGSAKAQMSILKIIQINAIGA